jgi:type IV pilus assembly protein PilW
MIPSPARFIGSSARAGVGFARAPQRGRTLIELLVAIALSLLILLGVGTLYLGANQSSRVAGNIATIEESGQIVMSLLGNAIRRAGYSEIIGTIVGAPLRENLLYNGPNIRGCENGRFQDAFAENMNCVAGGPGDTVAVWFQADSRLASTQSVSFDCLGNGAPLVAVVSPDFAGRVPQIPLVRNVYFVQGGSLFCQGSGNAAPQALADNVEDFKVFYGFDDNWYANAGNQIVNPSARTLRTATEINALANVGVFSPWDFVVSVHLCVQVRTQETGITAGTAGGPPAQFRPCPQDVAEASTEAPLVNVPVGGAVRRAYNQVFTVRSRAAAQAI